MLIAESVACSYELYDSGTGSVYLLRNLRSVETNAEEVHSVAKQDHNSSQSLDVRSKCWLSCTGAGVV